MRAIKPNPRDAAKQVEPLRQRTTGGAGHARHFHRTAKRSRYTENANHSDGIGASAPAIDPVFRA
ncbi:hypothetical protein K7N18_37465 [Burkholderia arboris]|uniref:hypothetical protein n=1 Tax=Burkholderia arboris TaxID=488730 RepID=UPI001CA3FA00|nr:hypothetical protein [Burkholderia arboris]MBY8610511.1 hypothetical protein [Burkholderia arboris]